MRLRNRPARHRASLQARVAGEEQVGIRTDVERIDTAAAQMLALLTDDVLVTLASVSTTWSANT